ncbi:MAG: type II toxin-antitoxin system RelE/ParE family toxin [Dehalococcoidia bacterium]|nr:type II toxin-antitoxin system RelE/ParE family toxin [Dehalococcoidia bacterium]
MKDFLLGLSKYERVAVLAAMAEVRELGLEAARHVQDEIWEVRASGENRIIRVLFAPEGRFGQVLLAVEGFIKKTRKTPDNELELAMKRLKDWRERGRHRS